MPGDRLLTWIRDWFDEGTVHRVFEPMVADWQRECRGAAGAQRLRSLIRGYACLALTALLTWPRVFAARLPHAASLTSALLTMIFIAGGAAIAMVPYAFVAPLLTTDLLPSAVAMAIPLAPVPVAVLLARRGLPRWQQRVAVMRVAIGCALVMIPLAGWLTPSANQRWREDVYAVLYGPAARAHVPRGPRELSVQELVAPRAPADLTTRETHSRATELHARLSVVALPVTMAALGLAAAATATASTPAIGALFWSAIGAGVRMASAASPLAARALFWWLVGAGVWTVGANIGAPDVASAWLPHGVALSLAIALHWRARRDDEELTIA